MNNQYLDFLSELFPFSGLSKNEISSLFESISVEVKDYAKGDVIFSPDFNDRKIGFIISGSCEVARIRAEDRIPLNTLGEYRSFGILSIFGEEDEYPTEIKAQKNSKILFISGEDFIALTKTNGLIALNIIKFLAGKVSFLNSKIETFSGKNTSEKLISYLLTKYKIGGNTVTVSKTKISAAINVGRASLYRDLDELANEGLIEIQQKKIIIIDPKGLERKIK